MSRFLQALAALEFRPSTPSTTYTPEHPGRPDAGEPGSYDPETGRFIPTGRPRKKEDEGKEDPRSEERPKPRKVPAGELRDTLAGRRQVRKALQTWSEGFDPVLSGLTMDGLQVISSESPHAGALAQARLAGEDPGEMWLGNQTWRTLDRLVAEGTVEGTAESAEAADAVSTLTHESFHFLGIDGLEASSLARESYRGEIGRVLEEGLVEILTEKHWPSMAESLGVDAIGIEGMRRSASEMVPTYTREVKVVEDLLEIADLTPEEAFKALRKGIGPEAESGESDLPEIAFMELLTSSPGFEEAGLDLSDLIEQVFESLGDSHTVRPLRVLLIAKRLGRPPFKKRT